MKRLARITIVVPIAALLFAACVPGPAPSSVSCDSVTAAFNSPVVEQCHLQYRYYKMDTTSGTAQNKANSLAATMTSCSSLSLQHTSGSALFSAYPSATSVAENLYCYSNGVSCPTANFGATKAMNGWIASSGHKANLDNFAGAWVNSAAACNATTHLYFAVAQFHAP